MVFARLQKYHFKYAWYLARGARPRRLNFLARKGWKTIRVQNQGSFKWLTAWASMTQGIKHKPPTPGVTTWRCNHEVTRSAKR
eukprot:COSAG02_NODE_217_length_28595_cov_19.642371_10_plen_83_part_00